MSNLPQQLLKQLSKGMQEYLEKNSSSQNGRFDLNDMAKSKVLTYEDLLIFLELQDASHQVQERELVNKQNQLRGMQIEVMRKKEVLSKRLQSEPSLKSQLVAESEV